MTHIPGKVAFSGALMNLRLITTGTGTFATGKMAREGLRDLHVKIPDKVLANSTAAGLDLATPLTFFGRVESKPFKNSNGQSRVADVFLVLAISALKDPEEIKAILATNVAKLYYQI